MFWVQALKMAQKRAVFIEEKERGLIKNELLLLLHSQRKKKKDNASRVPQMACINRGSMYQVLAPGRPQP